MSLDCDIREKSVSLEEVPTAEDLEKFLAEYDTPVADWGKGNTKKVSALFKELQLQESALEVWKQADGKRRPVRVTYVLRAKVCSASSYERGIFLFNTWQQYADGRQRTRNALLSEKLSVAEMPLEQNLHEVCVRAIKEEMGRTIEAAFRVGPSSPAPEYDLSEMFKLEVIDQKLQDHSIEVEVSKSYPGLLTMYHLYTVDIVCTNLPNTDFNTLEYKEADGNGCRPLKYVHAWVWLEWSKIQRYLFEGSKLKETRTKGSFKDPDELATWLQGLSIKLEDWGRDEKKSVGDLFREVDSQETQLEVWDRHDGGKLLMRVVHLVQLKIRSADPRLQGRVLFQTWMQRKGPLSRFVYRFLAKKLSFSDLPMDRASFIGIVETAVKEELSYVVEPHFQYVNDDLPHWFDNAAVNLQVTAVDFLDHRTDVEESPSYKGLCTLYHIYTADVECEGLPLADFASMNVVQGAKGPRLTGVNGWSWVSFQACLDMFHTRDKEVGRHHEQLLRSAQDKVDKASGSAATASKLAAALQRLEAKVSPDDPDLLEAKQLATGVRSQLDSLDAPTLSARAHAVKLCHSSVSGRLPPSMISTMSDNKVSNDMKNVLVGLHETKDTLLSAASTPRSVMSPKTPTGKEQGA